MVEVPDALAGEVLRYLVLGLRDHVRRDGGIVSAAATRLLYGLAAAADRGGSEVGTPHDERAILTHARVNGVGIAEAAGRLGCSAGYLRRLARTGRIAARRSGGVWLVDLDSYRKDRT